VNPSGIFFETEEQFVEQLIALPTPSLAQGIIEMVCCDITGVHLDSTTVPLNVIKEIMSSTYQQEDVEWHWLAHTI